MNGKINGLNNPRTTRQDSKKTLIENRVDVVQTRSNIRSVIVPQTLRQSLGNRVISVAFVPFIRSRTITFTA